VFVGDEKPESDTFFDFKDKYVSPGFIDLHTHGAGGFDFLKEEPNGIIQGTKLQMAHGATTILPTISAAPFDDMRQAVKNIANAMENKAEKPNILGVHMEGPYLSKAQCGAQCTDYITPPLPEDYKKLIDEYGAFIRRWTYAPEEDKDGTIRHQRRGVTTAANQTQNC
jgi:N-acetylglucosamine-6-phosphate deacetylase